MWRRGLIGSTGARSTLCRFSVTPLSSIKLGHSGDDSRVGGFVYILGPSGSLQRGWDFLPLQPQPAQVFSVSGLRLYFPMLGLWGARSTSCCLTGLLQLYPPCSTLLHLAGSTNHRLAASPAACLHPSYWAGSMFLLYLLGCRTSIQFDFLSVLVFYF